MCPKISSACRALNKPPTALTTVILEVPQRKSVDAGLEISIA
jgi:hypothetical protein